MGDLSAIACVATAREVDRQTVFALESECCFSIIKFN
jgi:hypothetical protein